MDVIVVSTNSIEQENFWQERLRQTLPDLLGEKKLIIAVHEDWPGGAGNGLGTLHAFMRAREKGVILYGTDIVDSLNDDASISIYHTAGKGKRLAPLGLSESGNKSSVLLPGIPRMTLLEAVIKQTCQLTHGVKRRVSVFWGDQVFISSKKYLPKNHVDIFAAFRPFPSEKEWIQDKLNAYGILGKSPQGKVVQIEKASYNQLLNLAGEGIIHSSEKIGLSFGSFSMSRELFMAFMDEFENEVYRQIGQMDTDPHFWMPLALPENKYIDIMVKKGSDAESARLHHLRIQKFKKDFEKTSSKELFGAFDIGSDYYWWDYGSANKYAQSVLKALDNSAEGAAVRQFYGLPEPDENNNILIDTKLGSGSVKNSLLMDVEAEEVSIQNSVIIESKLRKFSGSGCLLYRTRENQALYMTPGTMRSDVCMNGEHFAFYSSLARDGKADWNHRLPQNPYSYEHVYKNLTMKTPSFFKAH